jgi:REP element-mobilizing transposase RayT
MDEKELPRRKPTRLRNFNYSETGAYFITICTKGRARILSEIVGGDVLDAPKNVKLMQKGKIADKYINQLNDFYDHITVDSYVIMPNHIHLMLIVSENGASRTV